MRIHQVFYPLLLCLPYSSSLSPTLFIMSQVSAMTEKTQGRILNGIGIYFQICVSIFALNIQELIETNRVSMITS